MSDQQTSATTSHSDSDIMAMLGFAVFFGGAIIGSLGLLWLRGVQWLVEHHILVAASADPLLAIPGGDGAGFDLARIVIVAAVLVAMVAIIASTVLRKIRRRRREAL